MTSGTYRCCACCAEGVDPELHAEKGRDFHDTNCTTCDGNADRAIVAERDAALAKLAALEKHISDAASFADDLDHFDLLAILKGTDQ